MVRSDVSMTTPICDFVGQYQESDIVRFHMPGHKGVSHIGVEGMDITEIKGADNLYEPEEIIAESEANATRLFGTARTVYSTEGASQCVKAMIHLAVGASKCEDKRPVILAARNVHKSFVYGVAMVDCDVEWLYADTSNRVGIKVDADSICECVIASDVLEARIGELEAIGRKPVAVYVTSPDYLGNVQDIEGLSRVCHQHDVLLLVDNAHGAYLHFIGEGMHPMDLGADICCDSAHKTLPVITGGAYLHISKDAVYRDYFMRNVKQVMAIYGSTSPSYLILRSLDWCNQYIADGYRDKLSKCISKIDEIRADLEQYVVDTGDRLKLTLHIPGVSGDKVADILRRLGGECEFADKYYVVLMLTPDSDLDKANIVYKAVEEAEALRKVSDDKNIAVVEWQAALTSDEVDNHIQKLTIRQAVFADHEVISVRDAVGRVCATPSVACPPAIPIVVSGEVIRPEDIPVFEAYNIDKVDVVKR